MKRPLILTVAALCLTGGFARAQVAAHCGADLTLDTLIADMTSQNLSGEIAFWGAGQTKVNLLLANAGQMALAGLESSSEEEASPEVRTLVEDFERAHDLPIPDGGPLIPSLRPKTADVAQVEELLTRLQVMEPWVDVPFSLDLEPDLGLELAEFRALWAQARAYARDEAALTYVRENNLIVPRAIRAPDRFRAAVDADRWDVEALMAGIVEGELTWVAAENIVWGWLKAGDRIRMQAFARALTQLLLTLREDFVADRPNFEALEPFSGYFSSWQRWEDLDARLLLMLGQRDDIPLSFFHQTLTLGFGETEPNIAAYDASQLFAGWFASGYQTVGSGLDLVAAQRSAQDLRRSQDMFLFLQVLSQGKTLGEEKLTTILEDMEQANGARWLGGPLLQDAFIGLGLHDKAVRAAEIAAKNQASLAAPFAYVTPQIRIGEIDLAREILAVFHREACNRVALNSERTYSWIEWLPLTSAAYWRVPVSRFDGI